MLPRSARQEAHFLVVVSGLQNEAANGIYMSSTALLLQSGTLRAQGPAILRLITFLPSHSPQPWLGLGAGVGGEQVFWH